MRTVRLRLSPGALPNHAGRTGMKSFFATRARWNRRGATPEPPREFVSVRPRIRARSEAQNDPASALRRICTEVPKSR